MNPRASGTEDPRPGHGPTRSTGHGSSGISPFEAAPARSQRALRMASEHLRHASLSHARTLALQARGEHRLAQQQSRMTQVFLSNAAYHLQRHADDADPAGA